LYPYGDTRYDTGRMSLSDDQDHQAAVWTVRALGAAFFLLVLAVTLVLSLRALHDLPGPAPHVTAAPPPELQAKPTMTTDLGPLPGVELPGYIANRRQALAALKEDRVAVVSLNKYSTETQAKAVAGSLPIMGLLVAPPGVAPAFVTTDLATWAKAQTDATRSERDEISKLLPTVDDPAFKSFYQSEIARLDKAVKNFAPDSAIVFGVVVKGGPAQLQALGARPDVRLVDVADLAQVDPKATFRGLRPEETAKANDPSLRPI
jgi:hypothetical protein